MASNGYVRRVCPSCLFYSHDREYGCECLLYQELWDADSMIWVSGTDYKRNPEIKAKHDEECEHYSDKKELKNQIREKFGIEKIDYGY